jgi:hypothetical protein
MSQNDFNIANQGFASFRGDLNSALQALASTSSGATAPATPYANQLWYDTANDLLKIRNEANSDWIDVLTVLGVTASAAELNQLDGLEVYGKTNILGTVTESSGVPTGAIMEYGSNANGSFLKFADGTMICKLTTPTLTSSTAVGNMFTSAASTRTYPAAFTAAPTIGASATRVGGSFGHFAGSVSNGASTVDVRLMTATSGATGTVDVVAVGRWF